MRNLYTIVVVIFAVSLFGSMPASAAVDEETIEETTLEETTSEVRVMETVDVREVKETKEVVPGAKPFITKCRIDFDLKSWSAFYKRSKGTGFVECDNGQTAQVEISAHGGGVSFGKSEIKNGHGSFTKVHDISQLFGSYAASEAHAGIKKSSGAQAMTKGDISLALAGTGEGYDLGFAFGKFKITRVNAQPNQSDAEASAQLR